MGFFGNDEVIDYTLLHKRGLLKLPAQEKKDEVIDYTNTSSVSAANPVSSPPSSSQSNPLGGFFDMTSVANSSQSESNSSPPTILASSSDEVSSLRVKVDDLEYKIDRLLDRIASLESNKQ